MAFGFKDRRQKPEEVVIAPQQVKQVKYAPPDEPAQPEPIPYEHELPTKPDDEVAEQEQNAEEAPTEEPTSPNDKTNPKINTDELMLAWANEEIALLREVRDQTMINNQHLVGLTRLLSSRSNASIVTKQRPTKAERLKPKKNKTPQGRPRKESQPVEPESSVE